MRRYDVYINYRQMWGLLRLTPINGVEHCYSCVMDTLSPIISVLILQVSYIVYTTNRTTAMYMQVYGLSRCPYSQVFWLPGITVVIMNIAMQ